MTTITFFYCHSHQQEHFFPRHETLLQSTPAKVLLCATYETKKDI